MINFDVVLHNFPCSIISIDVQDIMGTHSINLHGTVLKNKLDKIGRVIGREEYKKAKISEEEAENLKGNDEQMPNIQDVITEINEKQGCQVQGYFYVNKVPGNFHISAHAYGSIVQQLIGLGHFDFNVSHSINTISFGDTVELTKIKKNFAEGSLNPLDGMVKKDMKKNVYEYYLKVRLIKAYSIRLFLLNILI